MQMSERIAARRKKDLYWQIVVSLTPYREKADNERLVSHLLGDEGEEIADAPDVSDEAYQKSGHEGLLALKKVATAPEQAEKVPSGEEYF
jgi:hypothetical protein